MLTDIRCVCSSIEHIRLNVDCVCENISLSELYIGCHCDRIASRLNAVIFFVVQRRCDDIVYILHTSIILLLYCLTYIYVCNIVILLLALFTSFIFM